MQQQSVQHPDRRWVLRVLGGGLVAFLLEAIVDGGPAAHGAALGDRAVPVIPRRPRPATLSPALFSGKTGRAYRIAKEVPELVEQMPCYCGCFKSHDHRSNLDCYVDRHAFGWDICQDITLDAYAMYKQGKRIPEIKAAIDGKYATFQQSR